MDYQALFDIVLGVAGALGMWIMNSLSRTISRLDEDVRNVPAKYIHKEDFNASLKDLKEDFNSGLGRVERSIDAIFRKLDAKEDKSAAVGQRRDT